MKLFNFAWQWLGGMVKHRVLHADDPPHRIALGVALGFALAWTPAIGLQTVLLILLGLLLRANIVAGMPALWLSNPFTLVPVYAPSYYLGKCMLGVEAQGSFVRDVSGAMRMTDGFIAKVQAWWRVTAPYAGPLWLGSLVVAVLIGAVAYVATYWAVSAYRTKHPHIELPLSGRREGRA